METVFSSMSSSRFAFLYTLESHTTVSRIWKTCRTQGIWMYFTVTHKDEILRLRIWDLMSAILKNILWQYQL